MLYFVLGFAALVASAVSGLRGYDVLRRYFDLYGGPIDLVHGSLLMLFAGLAAGAGVRALLLAVGIS